MATEVCLYFKFGYCRYQQTCRKLQVNELCDREGCDTTSCDKRHPKPCRYWRDYGNCKFQNYCLYGHRSYEIRKTEFETMKNKLELLEIQISQILCALEPGKKMEKDSSDGSSDEKLAADWDQIEASKKSSFTTHDENRVKELEDNFYVLLHSVDDLEKAVKFRSKTMQNGNRLFPCNYCGLLLDDESSFKKHLRIDHG